MNTKNTQSCVSVGCDECGSTARKIIRKEANHRYCTNCYARLFKRLQCSDCGNYARINKKQPKKLCRACQLKKPCHRCEKTHYEIGLISQFGPVCKGCSRYYRELSRCESCGNDTSIINNRVINAIKMRVCNRCAQKGNKTCSSCGRYRKTTKTDDGHELCKLCAEVGLSKCGVCQNPMPAGYGLRCQACYWQDLFEKRKLINEAGFTWLSIRTHFSHFADWLQTKVGTHKASITINDHAVFFMEIDSIWDSIPTYEALLDQFGDKALSKKRLIFQWLGENNLITVDPKIKNNAAENRRISNLLNSSVQETVAYEILHKYYQELIEKHTKKQLSLKSIRLALSPAVALMNATASNIPSQQNLTLFLVERPGQRAAITGFVNFLRNEYNAELDLPATQDKQFQKLRRKNLELKIATLQHKSDHTQKEWLLLGLQYFHNLGIRKCRVLLKAASIEELADGYNLMYDHNTYFVPRIPENKSTNLRA